LDFAVVDEVISGLVLGWAGHIESFRWVSYIMSAKNASISGHYSPIYYRTQEGGPSIYAGCGLFFSFIIEILSLFGELREGKFLRGESRP
jgi:hypothetical protein